MFLLSGINPFQIEDEELMLDNIQSGKWNWLGPHWAKISKDAQELIQKMLATSPNARYSVDQCLSHKWFADASAESIGDVAVALKDYQAKKKLKGAILGVMAAGKMRNLMSALRASGSVPTSGGAPAAEATKAEKAPAAKKNAAFAQRLEKGAKIEIEVLSGKDLAPRDANGKSDPYLRFFYGQTKLKSTIQKKTLNPNWKGETFLIPLEESERSLKVQCWDWDLIGSDEFMGEFSVDISQLKPNDPVTAWYTLGHSEEKKKKEQPVTGAIQLKIQRL